MTAPDFDLALVKDDVGIVGADDDAWLQRRIDATWARFETYTARYLGRVAVFEDDWSRIAWQRWHCGGQVYPPFHRQAVSPFLTVTPVVEILAASQGATPISPALVMFDPASGLIESLAGNPVRDQSRDLALLGAKITYRAGFAAVPGDLYEALVAIIRGQYATRKGGLQGVGALAIKTIAIADVGSIGVGGVSGEFESAAMKAGNVDPFLGPWTATLDSYRDLAASLGREYSPTVRLVTAPAGVGVAAGGSTVHS